MGNGSMHGKDAKRYDHPPKGARVVGEGGRIEIYQGESDTGAKGKKKAGAKVKKKRTAKKS
jgi:hypothetical protein